MMCFDHLFLCSNKSVPVTLKKILEFHRRDIFVAALLPRLVVGGQFMGIDAEFIKRFVAQPLNHCIQRVNVGLRKQISIVIGGGRKNGILGLTVNPQFAGEFLYLHYVQFPISNSFKKIVGRTWDWTVHHGEVIVARNRLPKRTR